MSNHTAYDGSKAKMPRLAARKAGEEHPYVIGRDVLDRYLTTVGECAKAGSLRTENADGSALEPRESPETLRPGPREGSA